MRETMKNQRNYEKPRLTKRNREETKRNHKKPWEKVGETKPKETRRKTRTNQEKPRETRGNQEGNQ